MFFVDESPHVVIYVGIVAVALWKIKNLHDDSD